VAVGITEGLALVAEHDKREALRRLIRTQNVQNALIFCNRKRDVDILYKSLSKHKFSAGALHGDMAQTVRFQTLEKFKAGELRLLVCSDVAARGLDIGGLSHVFNFDVPIHAEDYVHRIGRTGRAGLEGHAFTIAQPEERFAVEAIEKLTGHPIPPMIVEGLDPIDWAEGDGRRRRGRAAPRKKAEARKPAERGPKERDRAPREKPAVEKPASEKYASEKMVAEKAPRDRLARDRTPREKMPREPAPRVMNVDEAAPRARAPHQRAPRPEPVPARDRLREDVPTREDKHREDHRREDNRRQDTRRDEPRRYRRDDDLGPSVVGFGDDVPAFMMLRRRTTRAAEDREIET